MKNTEDNKSCLLQLVASLIGGVVFFYLLTKVIWWVPSLAHVLGKIREPLKESETYKVIAVTLLTIAAFILVVLKKRLVVVFALLELVAGWWTIWVTFSQNFENDILYALSIGGGVFLVVHGLENLNEQNETK